MESPKFGTINIQLGELIETSGLSKNKFAQLAQMQRTQLNKYISGEVALLSIDVLARICTVLDCDVNDILKFEKPEQ